MRQLLGCLVVASALAGCETTLSDMRQSETPRVTFATTKSVDATVRCLTGAYAGLEFTPSVIPAGDGQTIVWPVANRMFVDIRPTGSGAQVTFYRAGSLLLAGEYQRATETCRD